MNDTTNNASSAILLAFAGFSFFSFADASVKWLSDFYSIAFLLFLNGLAGSVILGATILFRKGPRGFLTSRYRLHATRSLIFVLTSLLITFSLSRDIPLSNYYGLVFTAPFFVLLFARLLLNEQVGLHRTLAVVAGFAGVLVIAGPHFSNLDPAYPAAIGAAMLNGLAIVIARKLGDREYWPLYGFYPAFALLLAYGPLHAASFALPDIDHVPMILFYAASLTSAQVLLVFAVSRAPVAAVVAPLQYTQMLWGMLLGWLVFSDPPGHVTLAGSVIIIGAGLYLIARERRTKYN
ncbi:MAG: DMT family transporter [Alphaproteobacteria bacterium]|nr:DMT family transporter [Alphaproteobacteria bacterium]